MLQAGENCQRIEKADRAGLVVGGEDYFRAVRKSLLAANKRVFILAWDIHSRVELLRGDATPDDDLPTQLGPFLEALLEQKPDLHVYVLIWDFSMIYAAEREWSMFSDSLRNPHPRLHFRYDDHLPVNASHHQKVVVIDHTLAYAGGLDLSVWRWDSAEHRAEDERRTDPSGKPYDPYHDVQLAVTGPGVRALEDLCRERWLQATGESLDRGDDDSHAHDLPWPDGAEPVFEDVDIAFSRTRAPYESNPAVREIESLHLDLIAGATDYLYFENQYFSSRRLAEALIERLREDSGPDVVIVITRDTGGWLEESTMGLLRDRLFEELSEADAHDRLRILYPVAAQASGDQETEIYVHAKVIIADDRILKVGSANLSNRSMRLDTELDLTIEKQNPDPIVRRCLHRLLGIHFGTDPEAIRDRINAEGGLVAALDGLGTNRGHTLRPVPRGIRSDLLRKLTDSQWLDPDEPIDPDYWIRSLVPEDERSSIWRRVLIAGALLAVGLGLVVLFKQGWGELVDQEAVKTWVQSIHDHRWAPGILLGAFLVAGLVGMPLNLFLVAGTAVMGPWIAFGCGYLGSHLSALVGFAAGHRFGKPLLNRFGSERIQRLNEQLRERSLVSVVLVRVVPIAPFIVVNLVAGASHLSLRHFNIGTFLGMAPGMAAIVILTHLVGEALSSPSPGRIALLVGAIALAAGGLFLVRKSLRSSDSTS